VLEPPADQRDAPVVFVEVQFQPDEGLYLRFFSELLLYLRQYQPLHPWHAVVLYPSPTIERLNLLNRPLLGLPNLHRIFLTEAPLVESPNPKLWLIALILSEETEVALSIASKPIGGNTPARRSTGWNCWKPCWSINYPTLPARRFK